MSKMCFAAMLAVITVTAGVLAEEKAPAAPQGFPQRMNMGSEAIKQFDKDGDGKLNDQERAAMIEARKAMGEKMRAAREKEFDKNGDGKLDDTERAAMMEALKQRHPDAGPKMQELMKRFDKDGDGKLNDEERKAMMEERMKHLQQQGGATPPVANGPAKATTP